MTPCSTAIFAALCIALGGLPALAQTRDDLKAQCSAAAPADRAAAIKACTMLLADPQTSDRGSSFYNRGNNYAALGDAVHAIADYDEAIAIDPRDLSALNNRAIVRGGAGDVGGALSDLDRVIAIEPQNATARHNRGNANALLGDSDAAIADYDAALAIDPTMNQTRQVRDQLLAEQARQRADLAAREGAARQGAR